MSIQTKTMAGYKIFFRMKDEEPVFESEEEVNQELEKIYLATDGEYLVTKDGELYCKGELDKQTGYDIKKSNEEYLDCDFSEIEPDIIDVIKIIRSCDCDCEEFGNMKTCGRCQAVLKLKEKLSSQSKANANK